jgi:hypothetical protein
MTPTGPGTPSCVETAVGTSISCGTPVPGQPFVSCPTGSICVQLDHSPNVGTCYPACLTQTCTC